MVPRVVVDSCPDTPTTSDGAIAPTLAVAAKPTAGRMTAADMFEKRKKDKNKAMIRKMKPLRIQ